jgi:hypothetical protein
MVDVDTNENWSLGSIPTVMQISEASTTFKNDAIEVTVILY